MTHTARLKSDREDRPPAANVSAPGSVRCAGFVAALVLLFAAGCAPSTNTIASQQGTVHRMTSLASFEGIEEPKRKWDVTGQSVIPQDPGYKAITDAAPANVRMTLRYRSNWWDGDQSTDRRDRQRAEVKGLGPHQKENQTFEYATTWRTNPDFTDPAKLTSAVYTDEIQKRRRHFCHVFQLKATDGDDGPPLVTVSVEEGNTTAAVDYWPGTSPEPIVVRTFKWSPGEWTRITIRIKVSKIEGLVQASVNDDPFSGVQNVPMFRPQSDDYRPKWGLYRAAGPGRPAHDDWVEHKDVTVQRLDSKE